MSGREHGATAVTHWSVSSGHVVDATVYDREVDHAALRRLAFPKHTLRSLAGMGFAMK